MRQPGRRARRRPSPGDAAFPIPRPATSCHTPGTVKQHEFEKRVLDLWMTTRIPMTRAALQYHSGAPRRKLSRWLDELVADGVVELDSNADGELVYTVPGAERPPGAPATFAEAHKLSALTAETRGADKTSRRGAKREGGRARRSKEAESNTSAGSDFEKHKQQALARLQDTFGRQNALQVAGAARRELEGKRPPGDKSLLLSTGLSLFLGPLGWLYAGAWREAIPASAAYLVILALIPTFLLLPILPFAMGISGVAGLVYGWQHNKAGERTPILGSERDE